MKTEKRTWLVLGASSSVAREFAKKASLEGNDIILAGRDSEDIETTKGDLEARYPDIKVKAYKLDVCDTARHKAFYERCIKDLDKPLSVFCAVGYMASQEEGEKDFSVAKNTITTNYMGIVSLFTFFTPFFEEQKEGEILVLGSVAGDRGRQSNFIYGSSKAGLHAYLQGLRAKLFKVGVSVTTVKPGFLDTKMTWGIAGMFLVASPEKCAQACYKYAIKKAHVKYYPWFWWGIMTIIKHIPEVIFKKLKL